MPTPHDVTIAVCTRNRPAMLADALAAIAAQTPAEVQVLVVDSGSETDETRLVAEAAGVDYVRSVRGLSLARNAALAASARPIVVYTDDDCQPLEGWIESLLPHFGDDTVSAVTGRMLDHTVALDTPYARPARHTAPIDGIDAGHGAIMAFRRDVLLRLGGFDDAMGAGQFLAGAEDLDIFVRLLRFDTAIVHEARCVIRHSNTRVGDEYIALHRGYGRGLGALATKWLRREPVLGARILWRLVGRASTRVVRNRLRGKPWRHEAALIRGIGEGMSVTWRLPIIAERFVPPWQQGGLPALFPPTPTREVMT
jgi:glycosyltransferase involved in cell wall biosynthesis